MENSGSAPSTPTDSLPLPQSLLTWECLRHFHKEPAVIAAWVRIFGPGLRWLTPQRRRLILGLGALYIAVKRPLQELQKNGKILGFTPDLVGSVLVVLLLFGFVWICYVGARKFSSLPALVRRHPQISLHAVMWCLLVVLWTVKPVNTTVRTVLTGFVVFLPFLLWRIGYMIFTAQRGKMASTRLTDHLAYIFPLWRGTDTPYAKGYDYLSANEARDEESLARSQLAGIKLLLLAVLWSILKDAMDGLVFGKENGWREAFGGFSLSMPRMEPLLAAPHARPILQRWAGIYLDLFRAVLDRAAYGHIVIGMVRLFGFYVFRNTYKPLLAENVVEFWNRYYYYFKELLVNFFFYPTFTRYFKQSPRFRLFAAVFMAAFVGNMYYHCIGRNEAMVMADFKGLWAAMQSRLFYCLLLALGIYISMRRQQGRTRDAAAQRSFTRRAMAIFGVWTFFSLIHIWMHGPVPFVQRVKFFFGLFDLA